MMSDILMYHMVPGRHTIEGVGMMAAARSKLGEELKIGRINDSIIVNGAKIVDPDMEVANGMAHGIDMVLIPMHMMAMAR